MFYKFRTFFLTLLLCNLTLLLSPWCPLVNSDPLQQHHVDIDSMVEYTKRLGQQFNVNIEALINSKEMSRILMDARPKVQKINGLKLVKHFAAQMESMLGFKIDAIKNIVTETEIQNVKHTYQKDLEFDYYNANFLNEYEYMMVNDTMVGKIKPGYKEMEFVDSEMFQGEPINWTHSTIQVPVNIYKKDPAVVNGIYMTESLNQVFEKNHQIDKTLTWQYFASSTGFFRNYPGVDWGIGEGQIDDFDARDRPWYLQASHSPKDIVILLDTSGSMTGSREFVARSAIHNIIDTLMDDDFFNVLTFSETVSYLEECFKDTLVQANSDNKEYLKQKTKEIKSIGIANFRTALTTAFKLLNNAKENDTGANCSQAIMLLTDGAVENFEDVFREYNEDKEVRVFTYIIGRDVKNSEPVKWMACNNKGYYAQIATLADVKINVMQYIHVLSRPMVIEKEYQYKWTNVYMDVGSAGLRLMTTVSIPAFDNAAERVNEGILLGVAGVDVPVSEMNKFTPSYLLGFNGYTFAITNNGYIIFHPELRPKFKTNKGREKDKPNYNSVDLSEVEMYDRVVSLVKTENGTIQEITTDKYELRTKLVNAETGSHVLYDVVYPIAQWTRAAYRDMMYFFTPLRRTPFRLGIALDRRFGMTNFTLTALDSRYELKVMALKVSNSMSSTGRMMDFIQLDSVNTTCIYCKIEETQKDKSQLAAITAQIISEYSSQKRCNEEIARMITEDAVLTYNFMEKHWKQRIQTIRGSYNRDLIGWETSIVADFIGTRSGFLRYQLNRENPLSEKLAFKDSPFHAEYFKIPASAYSLTENEDIMVFWVPTEIKTIYGGYEPIEYTTHRNILAVAKLVFAKQPADNYNSGQSWRDSGWYNTYSDQPSPSANSGGTKRTLDTTKAIASVVGMYLDLDYAYRVFNDSIGTLDTSHSAAEEDNNVFTKIESCTNSSHIDCYLLDHHGYIVMSENKSHISQFFGTVDGNAMESLVNHTLYKRMVLKDMQGMCVAEKLVSKKKNAAVKVTDVMGSAFRLTTLLFHFLFQVLFNFSINFIALSPWEAFHEYVLAEGVSRIEQIEHQYNPCDMEKSVFLRDFNQPKREPDANTFPCESIHDKNSKCDRDYLFQPIKNTNLIFLVVMNKIGCRCAPESMELKLRKKEYIGTGEFCSRLVEKKHRMRPPECHSFHKQEDSKHCGRGNRLELNCFSALMPSFFALKYFQL